MGKGRRLRYRSLSVVFAASARACGLLPVAAQAQSKLEARYAVTLAGIPLGTGTWVIDVAPDQYTAVASGRTTGLVKLISDGSGSERLARRHPGREPCADQLRRRARSPTGGPTTCA